MDLTQHHVTELIQIFLETRQISLFEPEIAESLMKIEREETMPPRRCKQRLLIATLLLRSEYVSSPSVPHPQKGIYVGHFVDLLAIWRR